MELNRRSALILGAAATTGLGLASANAQTHRRQERRSNPVLFWNAVCLDLVALDHSIDAADAGAPGPCASARALGLLHSVIADATYLAYRTAYKPQFYRGSRDLQIEMPDLFIGGAAAAILAQMFSSPMHAYAISAQGERFKKLIGSQDGGNDWRAGVAFANSIGFREHWAWDSMRLSLLPQFSVYIPKPRRHNIDPFNTGQGFYGYEWGNYRPLVLQGPRQVASLAPGAPPEEGSPEYERDVAEVRVKGALFSKADRNFAARTTHETNIGLFWAYDGARMLGTPPRLYNQILRQIAIQDGLDVAQMARLFALCNLAMADASIVTWWTKYRYAVWRPVLGIQNHLRAPQHDWLPLGSPKTNPVAPSPNAGSRTANAAQLVRARRSVSDSADPQAPDRGNLARLYRDAAFTPNFPAYPSGHSAFGGACFTMLKLLRREQPHTRQNPDAIGGEFISDELNGVTEGHAGNGARPLYPIAYRSIDDMIQDNELSRVYLGVHWRFDCNRGTASGAAIARAIYDIAYRSHEGELPGK